MAEKEDKVRLKRRLGLIHGVAIICGLIVGSGIYISPKGVMSGTGSAGLCLLLWAASGLMGTCGALSFAELGTTFPSSGEKYAYLEEIYGPFVAFLFLWMYMLFFRPGGNSIKCLTFGLYVLQPFYPGCDVPRDSVVLLAVCMACLLTFINCVNVKWSARGQNFFTFISLLALFIISITGLVWLGLGNTEHVENAFEGTSIDAAAIALAFYSAIFASWGWNALNFMVEELKNPYRNLIWAICISMGLVTVLYVLVNMAYIAVLGTDGVLQADAVAVVFAQKTLGGGAFLMSVFIALNTAGSFNSGMLVGSRLCFVGARRGHLPDVLALIHVKYFSPITALIFQCFLVVIMCCTFDLYWLLNNLVFALSVFDILAVAGMIYLRYKKPDLPRPIKLPLVIPAIFVIFLVFLLCIPLVIKPRSTSMGLLIVLCTGIPYYIIVVLWKSKPETFLHWTRKFTTFVQKLLCCAKEESGTTF